MALAGVDENIFISVFSLDMDDVLAVVCVVTINRIGFPKSVIIYGLDLLLVVVEQEPHSQFIVIFCRNRAAVV